MFDTTSIAIAAAPSMRSSWNFEPACFSTPLGLIVTEEGTVERARKRRRRNNAASRPSSERFDLIDDDKHYQLTIDFPGEEDIDIKVAYGRLIVQGKRTAGSKSSRPSPGFFGIYTLDRNVDADSLSATLENGVLTISAPKEWKEREEGVRRIPVTTPVEYVGGEDSENKIEIIDVDEEDKDKASPSNKTEVGTTSAGSE